MSHLTCPGCERDIDGLELAGFRTWCFECFDKMVPELPLEDAPNGWYLEEFGREQWRWVKA